MMQKGHNQKSPLLANQGTFPSPQTNFTTSKWRKSTLNASSTNPAENPETINTTNYPKARQRKAANSKDRPTMNCRTPISMQSKQTFQPENNHHERDHLQTHLQGQKRAACQEKQPTHHVPFLWWRLVSCYYCHQVQSVPVTTETFQCGTCKAVNECQSLFDVLKCEQCNAKVLYVRGSS